MKNLIAATVLASLAAAPALAQTQVPGHASRAGTVNGHYTQEGAGCDYVVNYRGDFGGDAYLDDGWIINQIGCPEGHYTYVIVNEDDPRYRGDPDWALWGNWEYKVLTIPGEGNIVRRP